ncbi:MAG TPA: GGDEF domain-containing protein [Gemmatimonadaceae bacterium]|nr:GGDEF domain-containing protein [Gemmatimonadaceae bacterium]
MRGIHRLLLALLLPEGVLLAAALVFVHRVPASEGSALLLEMLPYGVLAAGIFLSWRFQRTRLLFGMALLALVFALIQSVAELPDAESATLLVGVQAVALLLPANLAVLAFLRERGLFSRTGVMRAATIAAQAGAILLVAKTAHLDALRLLSLSPIPERWLSAPQLGQVAALAFVLAGGVLVTRALLSGEPFTRSLLWALAASFLALDAMHDPVASTTYLSTAGLMLVVGTIEGAHAMAFRDELTGLPARRALNELLGRLDEPYTVAMVDIDHFKQFNDRHGHEVGDQVLRMVASRLSRVGGGGRAFRYGGEEFTIVFPGRSIQSALPRIEELRADVKGATFTLRRPGRRKKPKNPPAKPRAAGAAQRLVVTVSIGVAQRTEARPEPEQVLQAADKALYRAKDLGRNRVEH